MIHNAGTLRLGDQLFRVDKETGKVEKVEIQGLSQGSSSSIYITIIGDGFLYAETCYPKDYFSLFFTQEEAEENRRKVQITYLEKVLAEYEFIMNGYRARLAQLLAEKPEAAEA
ncbi:MAG: hypothetical protein VB042_08625 [Victivallaceae bacterium]|nr:hypothetical protein [Victivallaceae bacterium]